MTRAWAVFALGLGLPAVASSAEDGTLPPPAEPPACGPCSEVPRERAFPAPIPFPEDWRFKPRRWWGRLEGACGRHFIVGARTKDVAYRACRTAETRYTDLLRALGFEAPENGGLYGIEIHRDKKHYLRRTRQPDWSSGFTSWNHIYTFAQPGLEWTLAHELVHLILTENLGLRVAGETVWLSEGLAAVLGAATGPMPEAPEPHCGWYAAPSNSPSFEATMRKPRSEAGDREHHRWYLQSEYAVRFIICKCGMAGMREILRALAEQPRWPGARTDMDKALAVSCGGRWAGMKEFELDWLDREKHPASVPLSASSHPNGSPTPSPAP